MWDIKEINKKKKEVLIKLKTCKDPKEKQYLEIVLLTYLSILNNSGNIRYTKQTNFLNYMTKGKYLSKNDKRILKYNSLIDKKNYIDEFYLKFLISLTMNIDYIKETLDEELEYGSVFLSNKELIKISRLFYEELADEEIYNYAKKILDDDSSLNFSSIFHHFYNDCVGLEFSDYLYNKSYCTIIRKNIIYDAKALTHEVMHGIEFLMSHKLPNESYYGFTEVATYTIDYIFIDYLEKLPLDKKEIQTLRIEKQNHIQTLARYVILNSSIKWNKSKNNSSSTTYITNMIDFKIIRALLEIESSIIAYGLYKQIKENKEYGLNNLKKFIKTSIPKDKKPDFSYIDLPDEKLLSLSLEMNNYLNNNNSINKSKKKIKKIDK